MPVNYDFTYERKGKHIFVPNEDCVRRGKSLIKFCRREIEFPSYFFHYNRGGHVAALHRHLQNQFFFRIDLENFFYSISRNRVAAGLHDIGFRQARDYAQWSCVKNPVRGPPYALPIGFVQSPVLASLVILRSPLAHAIDLANSEGVFVSVYFDDFIGSSADRGRLEIAYEAILGACAEANFVSNALKLAEPAPSVVAFNCDLSHGIAAVTEARVMKFFDARPTEAATRAFESYRARVASANYAQRALGD